MKKATNEVVQVTEKAPRVLVEFLVYGIEEDKAKIKPMLDDLQNQLFNHKKGKLGRILWYIDAGEKSVEEKKEWLYENTRAKYYILIEAYSVPKDYIKTIFLKIKKLEDAIENAKLAGLIVSKNKPVQEEVKQLKAVK
jgi:hypothetical protein